MAEGRQGLEVPISGYVIAEDRSFGAQVDAVWRKARHQAMRVLVHGRRLRRNIASGWAMRVASRIWLSLSAIAGGIHAAFALLRHLLERDDAVRTATPRYSQRKLGAAIVGLIVLAFAAALFMPERGESGPMPDAVAPKPAPVVVAERNEPAPPAPMPASLSPPQVQWQPLRKPMAMFHLESPETNGLEMNYRVSMRGTSRQDSLIWTPKGEGADEARRALVQLVIERHEGGTTTERPLFADLAARAAEQHLVIERMARPQDIRTKFGPMEAAEANIRQEGRVLSCIGFRRIDMAGLTLVGWSCGTAQRPVDRVALTCFIDRLDLVGGGRDAGLRKIFSEAERARQPCASARQSGKRLTWLDHEAPVPGLKLSARTR